MQFIFSCANNVSPCLPNICACYCCPQRTLNTSIIQKSSEQSGQIYFLSSKEAPAFPHMMYHRLNNTTSMIFFLKKTSLILPPIVVSFPATFNTRRLTPPLSFFCPGSPPPSPRQPGLLPSAAPRRISAAWRRRPRPPQEEQGEVSLGEEGERRLGEKKDKAVQNELLHLFNLKLAVRRPVGPGRRRRRANPQPRQGRREGQRRKGSILANKIRGTSM